MIAELLKQHYGFDTFRPGQADAIRAILANRDVVVVLPTGGGKSLIYQLPALILPGITVVISPLIALMKDQVDSLAKVGIPATFINSSLSISEVKQRFEAAKSGDYKLVYIAPERFYNSEFCEVFAKLKVSLFAIDEAHCISQWGHDFRPAYLKLKKAAELLGRPPIVALTATATPEVRTDISKNLGLIDPLEIVTGFARPNLQFFVTKASDTEKVDVILAFVEEKRDQSGIIYAGTRNKADQLAEILNRYDHRAVVYHAGMDPASREWVQNSFMNSDAKIVVATNAFGMGIDKKDVRFVIHHDMPATIEAYYQEAGRAGRDNLNSYCLLLYAPKDRFLREFFIKGDNPPAHIVTEIYDFLINKEETDGSVLVTYAEITKQLSEQVPEMAVGSALKILERAEYISRPKDRSSAAFIKILEDSDKVLEALGKKSKKQREIIIALLDRFLDKLLLGMWTNMEDLATLISAKKDTLVRALKKLAETGVLEYRPPFRGTEVMVLRRIDPYELEVDFKALEAKMNNAYRKLDEMEEYIYHHGCRQQYILDYFGDFESSNCNSCDSCLGKHEKHRYDEDYRQKQYLSSI